jgi:hypothetical protein
MISNKGLIDLAADYRRALGHVNKAAAILEDASILAVDVTGQFGPTASANLIASANELYVQINSALNRLQLTKPDD